MPPAASVCGHTARQVPSHTQAIIGTHPTGMRVVRPFIEGWLCAGGHGGLAEGSGPSCRHRGLAADWRPSCASHSCQGRLARGPVCRLRSCSPSPCKLCCGSSCRFAGLRLSSPRRHHEPRLSLRMVWSVEFKVSNGAGRGAVASWCRALLWSPVTFGRVHGCPNSHSGHDRKPARGSPSLPIVEMTKAL